MPAKTRKVKARSKIARAVPAGARWWLENGRSPALPEGEALGLTSTDIWQAANLHFERPLHSASRQWTRADLRAAGYGAKIDANIEAGRCPPDGWRERGAA